MDRNSADARSSLPVRQRRSARVLLLDQQGRVLLLRFVIQRTDGEYEFWAAPGGAVKAAETDAQAATRELHEELGLAAELGHPVHTATGEYEFDAHWNISTELFFNARWDGSEPQLAGSSDVERNALREWRWWSADAIRASTEDIYPDGIARLLDELRVQVPAAR